MEHEHTVCGMWPGTQDMVTDVATAAPELEQKNQATSVEGTGVR